MILTRFEKKLLCIFSMKSITLNLFKHPYKLKKRARPRWVFCLATVKLRKKKDF